MSETIGFVGVGMQGGAIARLSADAGYQVLVSNSRGPETLTDLVAELGEKARAVTAREAIESCDIVVLSVPMSSCKSLPMDAFAGKIVVATVQSRSSNRPHSPAGSTFSVKCRRAGS